eukprot:s1436_g7.t1
MKRQYSPPDKPEIKRSCRSSLDVLLGTEQSDSGWGAILRSIQTGRFINTMWADEGTISCNVQMAMVRLFMIWPLKAVTPVAYLYWAWRLIRTLSGKSPKRVRPDGAMALLRAAAVWGLQELLSLILGLEVLFFCYYRYKRAMLQEPALPPRMAAGKSMKRIGRAFMSHGNAGRAQQIELTKEIQRARTWRVAVSVVCDAARTSITLNVIIFTALVNASVHIGVWDWAARLLQNVWCSNIQVDNLLHNAVTRVFCAALQWSQAFLQLADLRAQSLEVDAHSTSAVTKAAEQGWQCAAHLLSSLVAADVQATAVNHNILLSRFEVSKWQRSLEVLHQMPCRGVERTVISLASAISACGRWEHSILLSEELGSSGLQANLMLSLTETDLADLAADLARAAISTNAAVSACEKQGQWWQAMQMLTATLWLGLQEDTISNNALISSCEKGGLWEQSLARLRRIRSLNILATVVTYSAAISACSTATSWQCAIHLFNELLQLERLDSRDSRGPFGGLASNSVAFNAAIIACEKGNQWESALNLMHVMHFRRLELDLITCNAVVNACSCSCRWQAATDLLNQFQRQSVERDVITVEAALKGFETAGLGLETIALLDELDAMFWK